MAQTDPISITPTGGSAISLGRTQVAIGAAPSLYISADRLYRVSMTSAVTNKGRRRVGWSVTQDKLIPDPLLPATNVARSFTFRVSYDLPDIGFTESEITNLAGAWNAWSTTGALAGQLKLLRGET
jgi:hypothetical protein